MRGWLGVKYLGKKRYVTLEWPLNGNLPDSTSSNDTVPTCHDRFRQQRVRVLAPVVVRSQLHVVRRAGRQRPVAGHVLVLVAGVIAAYRHDDALRDRRSLQRPPSPTGVAVGEEAGALCDGDIRKYRVFGPLDPRPVRHVIVDQRRVVPLRRYDHRIRFHCPVSIRERIHEFHLELVVFDCRRVVPVLQNRSRSCVR